MSDLKNLQPTGTEARVCQDIAARQAKGIAKYGTTVEDNPLGLLQWLQHAYEETLDQAVYLKRAIEQLQGVAPDAQPKAHIDLPVVELSASMRCGDAINVPPLTVEKPWYPDDGDWKEVPCDLMGMPHELNETSLIAVVVKRDRELKMCGGAGFPAVDWAWDVPHGRGGRIVAYKVLR